MRLSLICESCRTRQNLFVPNPDLRPEKTKTAEAGARLKFDNALREMDALRVKAGYCNTRATDYLDTVMTITNPATFDGSTTNRNIPKAEIFGVEAEPRYDLGSAFATLGYARIAATTRRPAGRSTPSPPKS